MTEKTLVEIVWLDACKYDRFDAVNLKEHPKDYLIKNTTYGLLYSKDSKATTLVHETSEANDGKDFTVIPNKWIIKITEYKLK
jgi:hypothetical protein